MANTTIELKHSQVSGNTPSSLANGEISINTADGRFFYKSPSGVITPFARYPGPAGLNGEIQFNDSGVLGSTANLSINKTTGTLSVGGAVVSNAYIQFADGSRQYTANAVAANSVVSVAGATGVVSNTQLINAVTSTNQITFNSIVTSNNGQGTNFRIGDDAWIGDVNIADTVRLAGLQNSANGWLRFGSTGTESLGRTGAGPLRWGANTVWHSGNDGTGSGLDADLLDGLDSTSFANATFAQAGFTTANSAYNKANSINAFAVISVAGQDNIVATSSDTNLNIAGSGGISVTTDAVTKTITITSATSATSLFVDGSDFGSISSTIIGSNDLGSIGVPTSLSLNLGELVVTGIITPTALILPSYSVSTLPNANPAAQMIFVTDESGGPVIAFSDGTNWRRVTDRAVVA